MPRLSRTMCRLSLTLVAAATLATGCASKPAAEVTPKELAAVRQAHGSIGAGASRTQVLEAFKPANQVKLGTSVLDGAAIEEWKIEAFVDQKKGKDLFVTFLYFLDDRFVDSSDTRIDFRNNPVLVERWKGAAGSTPPQG